MELMLLFVVIAGMGCDRGGETSTATKGGSTATPRIAVIPKGTGSIFWEVVHAGALAGGKDSQVQIEWDGPAKETDTDVEIRILSDMLAKGVNAVVIAPQDASALAEPIKQAHGKLPVVVMDSAVNTPEYTSFVATDNLEGGRIAGRQMLKLLGDAGGKVAVLCNDPGSASTMDREKGFSEVLAGSKVTIVQQEYHNSDAQKANRIALDILLKYPDLAGIYASNEPGTIGVINALKDPQNKDRHLRFVGFDTSDEIANALDQGVISALVLQDPFKMGRLAVQTAAKALKGESVSKEQPIPPTLVTAENKAQPDIQQLLRPKM
jgi:ribose transport system substrate-binding protein